MTFSNYAKENGIIWFSPKIVAQLMQCSIEHVYNLAKSGRVPYIKDGRNIRFRPEDLDAYEQQFYNNQGRRNRRKNGSFHERRQ